MKKILINLISEQRIQNLIAIRHFKPDAVVALATPAFKEQIKTFEFISKVPHREIQVKAYKLSENLQILQSLMEDYEDSQLIINYTGGTKIMALSAILKVLLSANFKVELAYVNSHDLNMESIIVNEDKSLNSKTHPLSIQIKLDEYIALMGENIQHIDHYQTDQENERQYLSHQLLINTYFSKVFKKQKSFFTKKGIPHISHSVIIDDINIFWDLHELRIKTSKTNFNYKHSDGGKYLTGSWLEELIFDKLQKSGRFEECAKNITIDYKEQETTKYFKNEIDVAVRKGFKTAFIECKAGNVTQDHIYKLHSITKHYLGTFGVPVLFSKFKPQPNIIEKCKDLNIQVFTSWDFKYLEFEVEKLLK
jgi:hypothetical protein